MSGTHYSKNIHWFPGHMKKALVELQEKVKLVDLIIENTENSISSLKISAKENISILSK